MNLRHALHRHFHRPLSCKAVNRFLADYLEGTLTEPVQAKFESHVAQCPTCATYLEQYRATVQMVKEDERPEPPEELIQITLRFLRDHLGEQP